MSRAKRVRKARAARRRVRRLATASKRVHALFVEAEERARLRAELNAGDFPDAVKTVLGFLVDPLGAVADAAAREMKRKQKQVDE